MPGWPDCYKLTRVVDHLAIEEIIGLLCTSALQGKRQILMHLLSNYQRLILDLYVYTLIFILMCFSEWSLVTNMGILVTIVLSKANDLPQVSVV